ncbi:hypothetical protein [Actinomadura sp. 9N215]|uniref:hypothetical protein n=1 Tax=Actinomadura sp. 9N215 TaxID=3375150 RepID=UPI0037A4A98E
MVDGRAAVRGGGAGSRLPITAARHVYHRVGRGPAPDEHPPVVAGPDLPERLRPRDLGPHGGLQRAHQEYLLRQGRVSEAVQLDVDNSRSLFGNKYDSAVKEML